MKFLAHLMTQPKINWSDLYSRYPRACKQLAKWLEKTISAGVNVTFDFFDHIIDSKKIKNNEEKLFYFLDDNIIYCGVYPVGIGQFMVVSESEYGGFVCADWPERRSGVIRCLENGFSLLEKRLTEPEINVVDSQNNVKSPIIV